MAMIDKPEYNLHMGLDPNRPYTYLNWRRVRDAKEMRTLDCLVRGNFWGFMQALLDLEVVPDVDGKRSYVRRNSVRPFGALPRKTS